jgi:hypothetical protein
MWAAFEVWVGRTEGQRIHSLAVASFVVPAWLLGTSEETLRCGREPDARLGSRRLL